jgi:cytochrome b subunit of formate dehydrogenase
VGTTQAAAAAGERRLFYRHRLPIRIMHWINVVSFFLLLMSGLGIFNAHPDNVVTLPTRWWTRGGRKAGNVEQQER